MEKKQFDVLIEERSGKDSLVFTIESKVFIIDLNSEDQSKLRTLFYEIVKITFSYNPEFIVRYDTMKYTKPLYIEIAQEYIKQLNLEIQKIIEMQPILS